MDFLAKYSREKRTLTVEVAAQASKGRAARVPSTHSMYLRTLHCICKSNSSTLCLLFAEVPPHLYFFTYMMNIW